MKAFVAVLILALLSGCLSQSAPAQAPQEETYLERPLPDTSKIYFGVEPMPDQGEGPGQPPSDNAETEPPAGPMPDPVDSPEPPFFDFINITDEAGRLRVHVFSHPGCPDCNVIAPDIDALEGRYPGAAFIRYDISTKDGLNAYWAFADVHGLDANERFVPQVLADGTILTGSQSINKSLEGIITSLLQT